MNPDQCTAILQDLIDRELELAGELNEALAAEREALSGSDPSALDAATAAKQACVERLDKLDAERRHVCAAAGLAADRDGMERLLRHTDRAGALTRRWQALLAQLDACRAANESNGVLVRLQRRRVTAALGLLCGEPAAERLYGDDGAFAETTGQHLRTAG